MLTTAIIFLFFLVKCADFKMEGNIVQGVIAKIEDFPHAAYMLFSCKFLPGTTIAASSCCGSSIVNQKVLITAAHCLDECSQTASIIIKMGNANKRKGLTNKVKKFMQHERWDNHKFINDIALVLLNNDIPFGPNIKRVALMRTPPLDEPAQISGWGRLMSDKPFKPDELMVAKQTVMTREACSQILKYQPEKTLCGNHPISHFAKGDSGSALVLRNYIQIGIVSYRNPSHSETIGVYTEVSKYIDWIEDSVITLSCLNVSISRIT